MAVFSRVYFFPWSPRVANVLAHVDMRLIYAHMPAFCKQTCAGQLTRYQHLTNCPRVKLQRPLFLCYLHLLTFRKLMCTGPLAFDTSEQIIMQVGWTRPSTYDISCVTTRQQTWRPTFARRKVFFGPHVAYILPCWACSPRLGGNCCKVLS